MENTLNHCVQGTQGLVYHEDLIFEQSSPGRLGYSLPQAEVPGIAAETVIPGPLLRHEIAGFPEVAELDVVRHFTRLSQWNYGIDLGPYPLGSCTMKYNPRVNEETARMGGFARLHPYEPEELVGTHLYDYIHPDDLLQDKLQHQAGRREQLRGMATFAGPAPEEHGGTQPPSSTSTPLRPHR